MIYTIHSYSSFDGYTTKSVNDNMKKHGNPATFEVNFIPYRRFKSKSIVTRTEELKEMLVYIQKEV